MRVGRYLVVFILFMGCLIIFGNRGIVDNYKMGKRLGETKKATQEISLENNELKKRIILLRSNMPYIEQVARNELGMVKKGDIVYQFTK